jgi:hypothetical protein
MSDSFRKSVRGEANDTGRPVATVVSVRSSFIAIHTTQWPQHTPAQARRLIKVLEEAVEVAESRLRVCGDGKGKASRVLKSCVDAAFSDYPSNARMSAESRLDRIKDLLTEHAKPGKWEIGQVRLRKQEDNDV